MALWNCRNEGNVILLGKKFGISWVRNSTNSHSKTGEKIGHAAEADSQIRRARSLRVVISWDGAGG